MEACSQLNVDVVIFGGGCAGLWLLDDLRRRGVRVLLLEAARLGSGQTAVAQGILHGGLKYSLAGMLSSSARMVREMPAVWNAALDGTSEPNLSAVSTRAPWCTLWRSQSLKSWTSMLGAVAALQVKPVALAEDQVPAVLAEAPQPVYRLDERVIDPVSLVRVFAERNRGIVWQIDADKGLSFVGESGADRAPSVVLKDPADGRPLRLRTGSIVLAAGEGNATLRRQLGMTTEVMQRRPLRVALVRGDLPQLSGHCVEGAKTRVTITSAVDASGRTVWQLGGQVSEDGVSLETQDFLNLARRELEAVLPGWQAGGGLEWAELAVNRAERSTVTGRMPGDVQILQDGHVLTVWPTKLVMAPLVSRRVVELLDLPEQPEHGVWQHEAAQYPWPAPEVARPPWERELEWHSAS